MTKSNDYDDGFLFPPANLSPLQLQSYLNALIRLTKKIFPTKNYPRKYYPSRYSFCNALKLLLSAEYNFTDHLNDPEACNRNIRFMHLWNCIIELQNFRNYMLQLIINIDDRVYCKLKRILIFNNSYLNQNVSTQHRIKKKKKIEKLKNQFSKKSEDFQSHVDSLIKNLSNLYKLCCRHYATPSFITHPGSKLADLTISPAGVT